MSRFDDDDTYHLAELRAVVHFVLWFVCIALAVATSALGGVAAFIWSTLQ
jgi:hypothetical protein